MGRAILKGRDARVDEFVQAAEAALTQSGFMPPARGEVRALVFPTSALSAHVRAAEGLLDGAEVGRAARLRFDRDRDNYIIAHALWRLLLARSLGLAPGALRLLSAPSGQPRLPGTGFSTSLSHSGGWVAMAVCNGESVGIDIEQVPPRLRMGDLIQTICTPAEALRATTLAEVPREAELLALWTRKEALLKAFGVGLAEPLTSLRADEGAWVAPPPAAAGLAPCRAVMLNLGAGLVGALAVPAGITLAGLHRFDAI
ncbi:MAG: 4'-phosphopantetheinyl transferase superfamily protein [Pseudomonadota bacterium]|nr:4'-phosphopantetheinyl transferase superfamily protein [Xanthomonadaceae bacterium]MDE2247000.1 4'-phosphopantetheinyl transferase superfamily protein [Xanthomonadaceae bacterium]MDE3209804.1 4'-phosphopantetheinyl transferase superfamily protein [Pseudomonadota bacterium]